MQAFLSIGSALVAFSGGADSTLLAKLAFDRWGAQAIAVTAVSPLLPRHELYDARTLLRSWGMEHVLIETDELAQPVFVQNPPDRCYHCKRLLFTKLRRLADERGITDVLEGSTLDDLKDYRPGRKAIEELGIKSPFIEAGMTKADVRTLSKELRLHTWNKPAQACLASRIPYGEAITAEKLRRVEQGEAYLKELLKEHYPCQVRVRLERGAVPTDGTMDKGRIETEPALIPVLQRHISDIERTFRSFGWGNVEIDPRGYRMGSLNEALVR